MYKEVSLFYENPTKYGRLKTKHEPNNISHSKVGSGEMYAYLFFTPEGRVVVFMKTIREQSKEKENMEG